MSRNRSDGGYFVVSKNDSRLRRTDVWIVQPAGSPYPFQARSTRNASVSPTPSRTSVRRRISAGAVSTAPSAYPTAITPIQGRTG